MINVRFKNRLKVTLERLSMGTADRSSFKKWSFDFEANKYIK